MAAPHRVFFELAFSHHNKGRELGRYYPSDADVGGVVKHFEALGGVMDIDVLRTEDGNHPTDDQLKQFGDQLWAHYESYIQDLERFLFAFAREHNLETEEDVTIMAFAIEIHVNLGSTDLVGSPGLVCWAAYGPGNYESVGEKEVEIPYPLDKEVAAQNLLAFIKRQDEKYGRYDDDVRSD